MSGNRCAFPKCSTPLVDPQSGSIVGEVCHIQGEKPGAARYDQNQSNEERHGFDNLILLCNVHHKVADDDELAYTVERLIQMKKEHETRHTSPPPVDEATEERFVTVAITNSTVHGSVVTSHGQIGGQTAHSITNVYGTPQAEEPIRLDGKLDTAGDLELLRVIGCPGMRLTIICRSKRPAKIQSAHLYVEGVDMMGGLQTGFGSDFGYTPLEGSTQTLLVDLIRLSPPNSPEGYVLERDDVCRFFYPLPMPPTMLALRAKPEQVWVAVRFFDDTEQTLLTGHEVQDVLDSVYQVYKENPGHVNIPVNIGVRVKSTTPPKVDMQGKYNPNYAPMVHPDPPDSPTPEDGSES